MASYVRNDDIVFSGNDATEYMNVCDGVYTNNENYIAFRNYMSEHMKIRYDLETGDEYLDCDFINFDRIDTIMMECDIDHIDADVDFKECIEQNQVIQASFLYEEDVEYIESDNSNNDYEEQYFANAFIIEIEAA